MTMRMYRLGKLARTSALPFALCLAPVVVFAMGVWIVPEKGTAESVGSTRHTWFESMYEAGSKRIRSVVGSSSSQNASNVWERHEAEKRAAAENPTNPESKSGKQQSIQRADELAKAKLKRDYGVDSPVDLVDPTAESRKPANLTPEQKRALEQEMSQLLPRLQEYDKRLGTYVTYRRDLSEVVDAVSEIRQRGSKPRVTVEADEETAAPVGADPLRHNPFSPSRIPRPAIERMTIVPPRTADQYVNELAELWPVIVAGPPEDMNLSMPGLRDLLNNLYADRLTVGDVEAETKIVKEFPVAERFVNDHITKMLRVARIITELGYHERINEQAVGSDQNFENRPERSTYELPPSIAQFQQNQALEERDRRRRDEEIARTRNRAMNPGSAESASNPPGSVESLKALLTDLVDNIQIGQPDESVRILRGIIPDEQAVRSVMGDALSVEQVSTLNGYYFAKQRSLSDAEVISILAPTRAQKVVEVTAVTSDDLARTYAAIDWTKIARNGQTFYRVRCITDDLKSCRQFDLVVWTGTQWCCLGRFWEVVTNDR
jgi:hypothetical protein